MVRINHFAVLAACWLLACGKTDQEDDGTPGEARAGSSAGRAPGSAGEGGMSFAGGSGGNVGGSGVLPAPDFPLIVGEGDCPDFAPNQRACAAEARCIYPGIQTGAYARAGEARCDCVDQEWLCVVSDERFQTQCPLVHWSKLRASGAACPADPELDCLYWVAGYPFGAACNCEPVPGNGGAGGVADREWTCAL